MSQEINYDDFQFLEDEDGEVMFSEIEEEVLFTKEMQELQSTQNKCRLLELERKISQLPRKHFNIYIGELSLLEEREDLQQNEICFVYAKGITSDWEFPLFTFYIMHCYSDAEFRLEKLLKLALELLFAVNLQPLACVLDWRPSNQKLLNDLAVTVFNPYIEVDRRRIMLCLDFFKELKTSYLDKSIPPDVMIYMQFFDKECDNLENWQTEFKKFKELLQNSYDIGIHVFVLYYTVASRIATLELAKLVGSWPVKMVSFRQTKMDLFLYRIKLEHFKDYEALLKSLPDIYREYY